MLAAIDAAGRGAKAHALDPLVWLAVGAARDLELVSRAGAVLAWVGHACSQGLECRLGLSGEIRLAANGGAERT